MPGPAFLAGERISLHPVEEDDHEFLRRNLNHPEVRPGFGAAEPLGEDGVAGYVEEFVESDDKEIFLVCAGGDPVGEGFLFDLDEQRGRVEIGYWIAPESQGNGYATATAELLVEYAIAERRLHKVNARVLAFNDGSRRVLEKVGFEPEGCRRDDFYVDSVASKTQRADGSARGASVDGEYVDADLYGIVADDWGGAGGATADEPDGAGGETTSGGRSD